MLADQKSRSLGLIFVAVVIGVAYLFGGFVPRHELLLAPAAAGCLAAAFWCGLSSSRSVHPLRRLGVAMFWTIAICGVLILPAGLRWTWLQREMNAIPIPADAEDIQRETNVVFWQIFTPPYSVTYVTRLSFDDADAFLTKAFGANGWKVGRRSPAYHYSPQEFPNAYVSDRRGTTPNESQLRNYTMICGGRWMNVTLFDAGAECWVDCVPHGEQPPDSLRGFMR